MKKNNFIYLFLIFSGFFTACSPSSEEAFTKLKQLEGNWKSSGNVIVFENWSLINDSTLSGYKYTHKAEEKVILETYHLQRHGDSVLLFILHLVKSSGNVKFALHKSRFGTFSFLNAKISYPNRMHFDFINDSTFVSAKENMRGNKRIEFEMKRWKK